MNTHKEVTQPIVKLFREKCSKTSGTEYYREYWTKQEYSPNYYLRMREITSNLALEFLDRVLKKPIKVAEASKNVVKIGKRKMFITEKPEEFKESFAFRVHKAVQEHKARIVLEALHKAGFERPHRFPVNCIKNYKPAKSDKYMAETVVYV